MGRPRSYDDELRVRLLEAAARVLADEGLAALTTRRVAAEVGTSTTAIYRLIGSKDELLRSVQLEGFRRLAHHLGSVAATDEPLADIIALGDAYHAMAVESPDLYGVMFGTSPAGFRLEGDDAAFALSTLQVLVDAVARAVAAGQLAGDPHELALQCWAVNHGITSLALTGMLGSEQDVARHLAAAGRALQAGHRPAAAPPG